MDSHSVVGLLDASTGRLLTNLVHHAQPGAATCRLGTAKKTSYFLAARPTKHCQKERSEDRKCAVTNWRTLTKWFAWWGMHVRSFRGTTYAQQRLGLHVRCRYRKLVCHECWHVAGFCGKNGSVVSVFRLDASNLWGMMLANNQSEVN